MPRALERREPMASQARAITRERGQSGAMGSLETFDRHRRLLFHIAYRLLGSVMDAEDVLQEAYLRWQQTDESTVDAPKAFLSSVVTRLCLDQLRSARARREQYVGPWLPEPLLAAEQPDPADGLALADSLSTAFLLLLETLAPRERAAFLLREVFDYDYAELARVLETSEANCRQLVARARRRLAERRPRFSARPEQYARLADEFQRAWLRGDLEGLLGLLAEDAVLVSDGGGKVTAARIPLVGRERIAHFLVALQAQAPADVELRAVPVNGRTGLALFVERRLFNVVSFELGPDGAERIYIVLNPDKLRAVARTLEA